MGKLTIESRKQSQNLRGKRADVADTIILEVARYSPEQDREPRFERF